MASITPQEFVAKWRNATVTERAASQSHFNDLCDLLGHPKPLEADPHGEWFAFEKGATTASGGQGWADVWKKDCFGWEYKGKFANLDKAYAQLLMYYGALDNPPLLIVSDINTIRIHTHFTNTVRKTETITLDDLLKPDKLELLRKAFTQPETFRSHETTTQVTQEAAAQFAKIAQLLRTYGNPPAEVAHFLIRLLFCLFAENVGILPPKLFSLSEAQVNELIAAYTQTTDGPTRTRLLAVRLYGTGYPVSEISEITRCSRTSLMEWCQKYLAQGPSGLVDHRMGGNSRKLTAAQVADRKERLPQYSPQAVFGSATATAEGRFWTVEDLQRAIQHWYGVYYQSRTSCLSLFARCGFSYQRPARVFKSRRAADVAAFEEMVEKNS